MAEPKILIYDLETSLQPVAVFQLANNDWINPDNLLGERYIICASWKWLGEKQVHSIAVDAGSVNDKAICKMLHKMFTEADAVVTHNGEKFDNKYLKTRMLFHGLPPLAPITSIDTYKTAKAKFNFNSNRLDYIGGFLGVGRKIHTTPGLWLRVMNGEAKAIREMVAYNKQDVLLLEKVFVKLRPYMDNYINRQLFGGVGCPRCGSHKVQSRGTHKAISRVYSRYHCQACGGWFRTAKNDRKVTPASRVL